MLRKPRAASDRQAGERPWRRAAPGAKTTHLAAFRRRRNGRDQERE